MNALVAVEHSILITVWNMLTTGELYQRRPWAPQSPFSATERSHSGTGQVRRPSKTGGMIPGTVQVPIAAT